MAATLLVAGLSGNHSATDIDLLGYALLVAGGLALAARRRAPVSVLAVTGLCAVGYQAVGFDVPAVAFLFAVYAAVRAGHRIITVVVAVMMLAALPLAALALPQDMSVGEALARARGALELAWLVAAGAAGEALRQAERRADEAERTREETALRRANEERLHIARELHDSLTHQISVIKVQAGVAVHLARKRGEQVPEALLAIQEAGREATRELRATLEALRDDGRTPPHGLAHVPELVERARMIGLDATLTIEGQRHDVPAAVDRTAYRIVQESLTNIARHAAAATASVRIDVRPDALAIRVDDDGKATPATAAMPGVGLLGMRERVTALGGRLRAEPRNEGGFTVHAELPVDRTS
ncbi:sensor histidine kinase [Micromonospora sp. DT47]|uniref:sensor histidine kinase n=1 Tax=Micromonospora sp. DT47 TaxID=3393431 RepID=UPI003CF79CBC